MEKYLEHLVKEKTGWWQAFVLASMTFVSFFVAIQHVAIPFYAPSVDHWCSKPEHLHQLSTELWKKYSIPVEKVKSGKTTYSSCKMFDVDYQNATVSDYVSYMKDLEENGNNLTETKCESWGYDESKWKKTIRSDWNLVCGRSVLVSVTSSVYMAGMAFGLLIFPQLSDRVGRRPVLLGSAATWVICGVGLAFSPNFIVFTALRFIIAMVDITCVAIVSVAGQEALSERGRVIWGNITANGFSVGIITLAGLAYYIRDWKTIQLITGVSVVILFILHLITPESIRWQLSVGRYDAAIKNLKTCAKLNGYKLPDESVLRQQIGKANKESENKQGLAKRGEKKEATVLDLFKTPKIRIRTLASYFLWFTVSFCYFAFTLNLEDIAGNLILNMVISSVLEIIGVFLSSLLMVKIGRRLPTTGLLIFAGVSMLVSIAVPKRLTWLKVGLSLIGRTSVSMVFGIIYIHTAEIMPTVARSVGVGSCSMFARFGAIISPYAHQIKEITSESVIFVIYGVLCILCGISALLLPETLNHPLQESIEDAENYNYKRRNRNDREEINSSEELYQTTL